MADRYQVMVQVDEAVLYGGTGSAGIQGAAMTDGWSRTT